MNGRSGRMATKLPQGHGPTHPSHATVDGMDRAAGKGIAGTAIELDGLSKNFMSWNGVETQALTDVTGRIEAGEFVCVLGPSGCGKSTLLNILAGFEEPTAGSVTIGGRRVLGPSAEHAVIFQDVHGSLMPWLTATENAELGLRLTGVGKRERRSRALSALEVVGLSFAADKYPFELSGGMQQRVQIARALALDAKLLLMDEPFGALDYFTRISLQRQLEEIFCTRRITVVLVTHDITEAVLMADKVWVMERGGHLVETLEVPCDRPRELRDPLVVELIEYLRSRFITKKSDGSE